MKSVAYSGSSLFSSAKQFVDGHDNVLLLCAYIKTSALRRLNKTRNIRQIVVRWEMKDICSGASDFDELYEYCRDNQIELFRNTRIHLKVIWDSKSTAFLGSANISGRGIESRGDNFNWELSAVVDELSVEDQQYLQNRILESQLITEERMKDLRERRDSITYAEPNVPELEFPETKTDYFLITQLPFFRDVNALFESYRNPEGLSQEDRRDLAHDLALYNIPQGLDKSEFNALVKEAFVAHPFIRDFCDWVKAIDDPRPERKASARFGAVRAWFSKNTTTVPTPRAWELSEDINTLYDWICRFDSDFRQTGRPHAGGTGGSNLLQYRPGRHLK